jgi:predicted lipid-binding transport protein (Tim44 family)
VIRFSAILSVVVVAIGLLVAGAVSGSLLLVYLAIGVAALALLMLVIGVVIWREELFGDSAARRPAGVAVAESREVADVDSVRCSGPGIRQVRPVTGERAN